MSTDRTRISPALARGLGFNGEDRYTRMEVTRAFREWLLRKGVPTTQNTLAVDDEVRTALAVPAGEALTVLNLNTYLWPHFLDFPQQDQEPVSERPPE